MGKIFANTVCSLSENFLSKIAKHKLNATLDKIRKTTGVEVDNTDITVVFEGSRSIVWKEALEHKARLQVSVDVEIDQTLAEGDWDNIYLAHNCLEEIYNEEVACSNACKAVTDNVLNPPRKHTEFTHKRSLAENKERKLVAHAAVPSRYIGNIVTDQLHKTQQKNTECSRSYVTEKCPGNERQTFCKNLENSNVTCNVASAAGKIIDKSGHCQNDGTELCSKEIKQEVTPSDKNETVNIVDNSTGMFIAEINIKKEPLEEVELHVHADSRRYSTEGHLKEERADVSDDENNKGCHLPSSVSAERESKTEKKVDKNHRKGFKCNLCSKTFGNMRDMKQHLDRILTCQGQFCSIKSTNEHLHMCKDIQDETSGPRISSCSDQEVNITQNLKNQNTARQDNLCAHLFHRWLNEEGDTRMMWDIPPAELDTLIGSFLLSIRRTDGEEYEPDTLTTYHHGIERCLREHNYPKDIITDIEFAASRALLKSKRKELRAKGKGKKPNAAETLSEGEEEILQEKECIGTSDMDMSFEDTDQDVFFNTELDEDDGLVELPTPAEISDQVRCFDSMEEHNITESNSNTTEPNESFPPAKRFKPTTELDILQLKSHTTEIATDRQTKWAVRLIKDWMLETGYTHSDFEWLPDEQLDNLLEQFYASVQTKDGKNYSKSALVGLRSGLNRHLTLPPISRAVNLMKDRQFHASNLVLYALVKALKKEGRDVSCHKEPIDETDIDRLYKSGLFDVDKPETLQNKVLFDIIGQFGAKGREWLRNLQSNSFVVLQDTKGRKYVKMVNNEPEKTSHGFYSKEKKKEPRMYENTGKFCPVKSFETYLSRLNPECLDLFQKPLRKVTRENRFWYAAKALGVNTLSSFMSRISKEACLSRIYTNHCIRVSLSSKKCNYKEIMSDIAQNNENSLACIEKHSED